MTCSIARTSPRAALTLCGTLAVVVGSLGCRIGGGTDPDVMQGEIGEGGFVYSCLIDSADAACDQGDTEFPEVIATGGSFIMTYKPRSGPAPSVFPAIEGAFTENGGDAFTIEVEGFAALLAIESNGSVEDIIHLEGAPIAGIRIDDVDSDGLEVIEVDVGEGFDLRAVPIDSLGRELAGTLEWSWQTMDPAIIQIITDTSQNEVELEALEAGVTVLRIEAGEAFREVEINVLEGGQP